MYIQSKRYKNYLWGVFTHINTDGHEGDSDTEDGDDDYSNDRDDNFLFSRWLYDRWHQIPVEVREPRVCWSCGRCEASPVWPDLSQNG